MISFVLLLIVFSGCGVLSFIAGWLLIKKKFVIYDETPINKLIRYSIGIAILCYTPFLAYSIFVFVNVSTEKATVETLFWFTLSSIGLNIFSSIEGIKRAKMLP